MADWWGFSRSNYFRVKDKQAFMAWLSDTGEVTILHEQNGSIAITGENFGGWPTYRGENCKPCNFAKELAGFLADGEIAVLIEAGAEKLRYITGVAVAIDNRGQRIDVDLRAIYDLAQMKFGRRPPDATY